MASITIRSLDESLKSKLRLRAAEHGRSMEAEAREILKCGLATSSTSAGSLVESIRRRVEIFGGVELDPASGTSPRTTRLQLMIVLDTNVVSELLKPDPERKIVAWLSARQRSETFITSITQAEVLYGVESLPEGKRKRGLSNEIEDLLLHEFQGRILPFDEKAARIYAPIMSSRRSIGRPISQFDAMIAAIVRSQNAILATRNTKDFEHCGVNLINPWEA